MLGNGYGHHGIYQTTRWYWLCRFRIVLAFERHSLLLCMYQSQSNRICSLKFSPPKINSNIFRIQTFDSTANEWSTGWKFRMSWMLNRLLALKMNCILFFTVSWDNGSQLSVCNKVSAAIWSTTTRKRMNFSKHLRWMNQFILITIWIQLNWISYQYEIVCLSQNSFWNVLFIFFSIIHLISKLQQPLRRDLAPNSLFNGTKILSTIGLFFSIHFPPLTEMKNTTISPCIWTSDKTSQLFRFGEGETQIYNEE